MKKENMVNEIKELDVVAPSQDHIFDVYSYKISSISDFFHSHNDGIDNLYEWTQYQISWF
jgi:hypothetical protein